MDVLDLFTHMDISVWEKIVRTLVVYLFILLVIRLAGRRMLAQMNALDLVVVLLLSNVVQNAIIGPDNSLLGGLVGAVVLVVGNAILDRLTYMFPNFGKLLDGRSAVVIKDGELDRAAMQRLSVTTDDLAFELGRQGASTVSQVAEAALTPGGQLKVDLTPGEEPVTRGELRAAVEELKLAIKQGAS